MSELDSDAIVEVITDKIKRKHPLTSQEIMELVMLPLTYKGFAKKKQSIRDTFALVKDIPNEELQTFILSGMLVFTDKIITRKDSDEIRRWINMTKVGRIIEEEKRQAIEEATKAMEIENKKITQEKQKAIVEKNEIAKEYAKTLIEQGMDTDSIIIKIKSALSADEVNALRQS